MKIVRSKILQGDKIIWSVYILFIFISIVEVFSSMGKEVASGSFVPMLRRHCLWLLIGFICCFIAHKSDYRKLSKYLNILLGVSLTLICIPYFAALVKNEPLSLARWIKIPFPLMNLQFQPSEIAKYVIIFYISSVMASNQLKIDSKEIFWRLMIPLGLVCGIVFWSNFSTTVLIFATCFLLMRIGGVNRKYLYLTLAVLIVVFGLMLLMAYLSPDVAHRVGRLGTIVSRTEGHSATDISQITQSNQALMAVATGGLLGRGIGNSIQSSFLEEGHNDFIFSIILEEGGIWLGGFIILLYIILLYRMFKTAKSVNGYFGAMACCGMGIVITLQALINMSVAVGLIPVTGQTLPFISYGGTSFVFASIFLGVVINISKRAEEGTEKEENLQEITPEENDTAFEENKTPD